MRQPSEKGVWQLQLSANLSSRFSHTLFPDPECNHISVSRWCRSQSTASSSTKAPCLESIRLSYNSYACPSPAIISSILNSSIVLTAVSSLFLGTECDTSPYSLIRRTSVHEIMIALQSLSASSRSYSGGFRFASKHCHLRQSLELQKVAYLCDVV